MTSYPSLVVYAFRRSALPIKEALAGIEEEGLLYELIKVDEDKPTTELARQAAMHSSLGVGIGLNNHSGVLMVRELNQPLRIYEGKAFRQMGHNGARYIKKLALKGYE